MEKVSVDSPVLPEGYVPDGTTVSYQSWADVEAKLRDSAHYWLSSTRPDGRPHVVPRWGVWLAGRFWYDGAPTTRHARNVEQNPWCSLHLESGSDVVIIEGTSHRSDPVTGDFADALAAEFARKYRELGYQPSPDSWSDEWAGGLRRLEPAVALAWSNFPSDLTRFRFGA